MLVYCLFVCQVLFTLLDAEQSYWVLSLFFQIQYIGRQTLDSIAHLIDGEDELNKDRQTDRLHRALGLVPYIATFTKLTKEKKLTVRKGGASLLQCTLRV